MSIFNKSIALLVMLVMASGIFPFYGFSQSMGEPLPGSVKGFDRSVFDYHFGRADREMSPERWLSEARRGIDLAFNAWEMLALDMFDDPVFRNESAKALEKWSEDELEYRFTQWLVSRFFGAEFEDLTGQLSSHIDELHLFYTYLLDENGNLLKEDTTGDPKIVRPNEEGRNFDTDYAQWREESLNTVSSLSESFAVSALAKYTELLAYIPGEMRDSFGEAIEKSTAYAISSIKTEFENIVAREERLFTGRRTGDIYSLRRKSDDEEARLITSNLIEQALVVCDTGIEQLQTRIEQASNGEGDLALMGTEWLEMYREQFERGLKVWEEAEERFFMRRIEWEQDSLRLFEQGDEAWTTAFSRLEEERQKWELQVKALFDSGEELFRKASENLETAIRDARIEFENNLMLRSEYSSSKAKALIDMYFTCVSTFFTAIENAGYWLNEYGADHSVSITEDDIYLWIENEKDSLWEKALNDYISTPAYLKDLENLEYWENWINRYPNNVTYLRRYQKALVSFNEKYSVVFMLREVISGSYNESDKQKIFMEALDNGILNREANNCLDEIKNSADMYHVFYERSMETRDNLINEYNGFFGAGALKDILGDFSSEDFVLDEYQIALVRAKVLVEYWKRRMEIAMAVRNYAVELGSGRMTEAESLLEWENANQNYEASITAYEDELRRLNDCGEDIRNKKNEMESYVERINETVKNLETLNVDYFDFIGKNSTQELLNQQLRLKYSQLLEEYKIIMNKDVKMFYYNEFELAAQIEYLQNYNAINNALELLILGNGEDIMSLNFLKDEVRRMNDIFDDRTIDDITFQLFFTDGDTGTGLANQLIKERDEKIENVLANNAGDIADPEIEIITEFYNGLVHDLCAAIIAEAETALAIRIMEIKLFSDTEGADIRLPSDIYNSADWYSEAMNEILSGDEITAGLKLEERLLSDYLEKYERLIEKRVQTEISALMCFLDDSYNAGNDSLSLNNYCLVGRDTAMNGLAALNLLSERIDNGEPYTGGSGELDSIIGWFLSGGSFFSAADLFITAEFNEFYLASGLYKAYCEFSRECFFIKRDEFRAIHSDLDELCERYMIDINDNFLPDIISVCEALYRFSDEFIKSASEFLVDFDKLFSNVSGWLRDEIDDWKDRLIENAVWYFSNYERDTSESSASLEMRMELSVSRIQAFEELYNSINDYDIPQLNVMKTKYLQLADETARLLYQYIITSALENINGTSDTEKHWRSYLYDLKIYDTGEIAKAMDINEGLWLDAMDSAEYSDTRINTAISVHLMDFHGIEYQDETKLGADYSAETYENSFRLAMFELLKNEFAIIGKNYENLFLTDDEFMTLLKKKQSEIDRQNGLFLNLKNEYLAASKSLLENSMIYDGQYSIVKNAFNYMEEKRHEYEIQDAIRRWASTAYLDTDAGDIEYCGERLERASVALDVLSNIYNNETENRPYDNSTYNDAYAEYEKSFREILISAKAIYSLESDLARAIKNNNEIFDRYISEINILGNDFNYSDYLSPGNQKDWKIMDIITVNNGKLEFNLDGIGASDTKNLVDYFTAEMELEGEYHQKTAFQQEAAELGIRMAGYFSDPARPQVWGLARDYLMRTLIAENSDIGFLASNYNSNYMKRPGITLGDLPYQEDLSAQKKKIGDYINGHQDTINNLQRNAWNKLSEAEKADLEFYLILTLNNQSGYNPGFSQFTVLNEMEIAYGKVRSCYLYAEERTNNWLTGGLSYYSLKDLNYETMKRIRTTRDFFAGETDIWKKGIKENIDNIRFYNFEYAKSCMTIDALRGEVTGDAGVCWSDIEYVLSGISKISTDEIALLEILWEEMISEQKNKKYKSVIDGLAGMANWFKDNGEISGIKLEEQWINDNNDRLAKEQIYLETVNSFIEGKTGISVLVSAAEEAYGIRAAAWKNHYKNVEQIMIDGLTAYHDFGPEFIGEFLLLAGQYAEMIGMSSGMGLMAELAAREAEWNEQRLDIEEKHKAWQETAGLIVERGREDWKNGAQRMLDSQKQWVENFQTEYNRLSNSWTEAYLAGLEDKEQWLSMAAEAANNAMNGAMLSVIGSEAERFSRIMDTREINGRLSPDAAAEAESVLVQLLNSPGIGNMNKALTAINSMGDMAGISIRSVINMSGTWDAGIAQLEASILSQEANMAIAARESKKLAVNAKKSANEALALLAENVGQANVSFRMGMDALFIGQGQWRINGDKYIKDIITGSTLFDPVVTERRSVSGYADYEMDPLILKTRLDDDFLDGLDSFAILALIRKVNSEVDDFAYEIFGNGESTVVKDIKSDAPRYMSSGKFGKYIGYDPEVRSWNKTKKEDIFVHQGDGELGRLLTEFHYWSIIDAKGAAEIWIADWDKRLWDDSDSVFSAPSLRSLTNTALQIGTTVLSLTGALAPLGVLGTIALSAAINSSGDLLFNSLDAAYGYKTVGEAGFAFGKSLALNTVSSAGSAVFGGIKGIEDGLFKTGLTGMITSQVSGKVGATMTQAFMTSVQTFTTGFVSSAIGAITYSKDDGLGISTGAFSSGMRTAMKNVYTSAVSLAVQAGLTAVNTGDYLEKLDLHSSANKLNVQTLNTMLGGLAGQRLSYAMGDDFTLNLLNTSVLESLGLKEEGNNSGLLELHIGQDGAAKMNIGTDGVSISPDTVWAAAQGAAVWGYNDLTDIYMASQSLDLANAFHGSYSFGDIKQVGQMFRFILGIDDLKVNNGGEYEAKTTINEKNKRTVTLNGYHEGMSLEEQAYFAIKLGHEAYRDINNSDIYTETQSAVLGHTEMALRMLQDGKGITLDQNLMNDLTAYFFDTGLPGFFNQYVDEYYDSSDKFWRLTKDDSGFWIWVDDKKADFDISELLNDRNYMSKNNSARDNLLSAMYASAMMDGKDYGTISAGRMTSDFAKSLAGSIMLNELSTQNSGFYSSGIGFSFPNQGSIWTVLYEDTLDIITYNAVHTTTVYDKWNRPVTLHNMDTDNNSVGDLLKQNSATLSDIENMAKYGCNFMDIISVPQILTKQTLGAEEIKGIWNQAIENNIMEADGYVTNRNALANLALQQLGVTNFGIDLAKSNLKNSSMVGYRVEVPYGSGGHFVLAGTDKSLVYNPGNTYTSDQTKWRSILEVSIYGK